MTKKTVAKTRTTVKKKAVAKKPVVKKVESKDSSSLSLAMPPVFPSFPGGNRGFPNF